MVLNFAREGETLTDRAFAHRIERFYFWIRRGVPPREACARAVAEVDYFGSVTPYVAPTPPKQAA